LDIKDIAFEQILKIQKHPEAFTVVALERSELAADQACAYLEALLVVVPGKRAGILKGVVLILNRIENATEPQRTGPYHVNISQTGLITQRGIDWD
jgi:hypothetical protein